jgi:hypothetical protein
MICATGDQLNRTEQHWDTGTVPASPQAENVTMHIAVMPFSLFRAIIPAVFSDSA